MFIVYKTAEDAPFKALRVLMPPQARFLTQQWAAADPLVAELENVPPGSVSVYVAEKATSAQEAIAEAVEHKHDYLPPDEVKKMRDLVHRILGGIVERFHDDVRRQVAVARLDNGDFDATPH